MEARGNQPQVTEGLPDLIPAGNRLGVPQKGGPFFVITARLKILPD